ncbi:MAG: bacillithiol biosynthesis deacetylase BshB1 [Bacteroidetes bacterium]|nr:MAG: bacillithiol biosynthesis deacetylase BshB1 [Bacteroidota bacterium]
MKVDILAIGVHPDDIELSCSGTLLHYIQAGKKVGLLDLTRGELGTRGTAEIRDREAANAAKKMGAVFRQNLGMADGFFIWNRENIIKIVRVIRTCQPEIIFANALDDRHPDHGRAAKLVSDACFYSGLIKVETLDEENNIQERWRPRAVYHYIQDKNLTPDFVFDITPFMEQKIELIRTFESQFYNPAAKAYEKELSSPISGKDFIEFIRAKGRVFGRPIGVEYAEGFNVGRTPGVKDLFNLI